MINKSMTCILLAAVLSLSNGAQASLISQNQVRVYNSIDTLSISGSPTLNISVNSSSSPDTNSSYTLSMGETDGNIRQINVGVASGGDLGTGIELKIAASNIVNGSPVGSGVILKKNQLTGGPIVNNINPITYNGTSSATLSITLTADATAMPTTSSVTLQYTVLDQ